MSKLRNEGEVAVESGRKIEERSSRRAAVPNALSFAVSMRKNKKKNGDLLRRDERKKNKEKNRGV